ncbi:cytochrome P450 [Antrihabitans cavernicola]|uniref:Cytochrome P450 n=1 Tax=Antrihabitans cavernicola TaxID=2495913 RepID=A0A5A7SFV1_9NOCA|nr:cytochrome P450 [Spelaeibacter cavernicola]KAA0025010.1 cytochrome P450 [Spelaeibacter cavernicola]
MSTLNRVKNTVESVNPLPAVRSKVESNVPLPLLVRAAHAYNRALRTVSKGARQPKFVEKPIPDGATVPLADIDMSNPFLYRQGQWLSHLKRLRDESPVHYQTKGPFGPFWSVTRYEDILAMDKNHTVFSAEPYIIIGKMPAGLDLRMFIAMDPPKHDEQRVAVQGVVAPKNLKEMESLIRSRVQEVLDELPIGEPFDWVDVVSKELTSRMLATLLDYPYDERRELTEMSDLGSGLPAITGGDTDVDETFDAGVVLATKVLALWKDKSARIAAGEAPGFDLISLMLSDPNTANLMDRPMELIGNLMLLVIGGNDTTRNSMTGGVYALNKFPDQFAKLKADPKLIPNAVSEIIRWQTPLAYMARRAKENTVVGGQHIRKGDKLIMWYSSGNRDERHFDNPDELVVDRKNARNHIAFGFGVHRCMGNRLAELQLRILWEELLERFDDIEVLEEPEIVQSTFVRGYSKMMVKLTKKQQV